MVGVAQLVRASGCGPEGRGFESHHSPFKKSYECTAFLFYKIKTGFVEIAPRQFVRMTQPVFIIFASISRRFPEKCSGAVSEEHFKALRFDLGADQPVFFCVGE